MAKTLDDYNRLEEALAYENELRLEFEAALASGALTDHKERANFEQRLAKAQERTAKERKKYKAAFAKRISAKTQLSKTVVSHDEKSQDFSGSSSVWKKYKSLMRSAGKKGAALSSNSKSEKGAEKAVSVWALARRGSQHLGGRKGRGNRVGKVNEIVRESSGRATQRVLEQLNDLVHKLSTSLTVEEQSSVLSASAPFLLSADVVDLFIKENDSFYTHKNENPKKLEKWPLNKNGSLVAKCIVNGHIIDLANAAENAAYCASPDCHVSGEQGLVKTLSLLIVPIVDVHGKAIGALRASRCNPVEDSKSDFGSVHS